MLKTITQKIIKAAGVGTTVSNNFDISDALRVGFLVRRAANAGGSSTFTFFLGMEDGTGLSDDTATPTMTATNMIINDAANTNAQQIIRNGSVAIAAANGDKIVWLDPEVFAKWVSVTAVVAADGNATAFLIKQVLS